MLTNSGWRETPIFVLTSCVACRARIEPGQRVFASNLRDAWNVYCETCGPQAETATNRYLAGERDLAYPQVS